MAAAGDAVATAGCIAGASGIATFAADSTVASLVTSIGSGATATAAFAIAAAGASACHFTVVATCCGRSAVDAARSVRRLRRASERHGAR